MHERNNFHELGPITYRAPHTLPRGRAHFSDVLIILTASFSSFSARLAGLVRRRHVQAVPRGAGESTRAVQSTALGSRATRAAVEGGFHSPF
eukprot:3965887-Prymnesium_polylepis.1